MARSRGPRQVADVLAAMPPRLVMFDAESWPGDEPDARTAWLNERFAWAADRGLGKLDVLQWEARRRAALRTGASSREGGL